MALKNEERYERLFKKLFTTPEVDYDASRFNDPVADQTKWGPNFPGGANYRTRKLVQAGRNRIEFRTGCSSRFMGCAFSGIGFIVFLVFGATMLVPEFRSWSSFLAMFVALIFIVVGIFFNRHYTTPIVFDKDRGYYWKSRKNPSNSINKREIKNLTPISSIHAIQIIGEEMQGSGRSYTSYEINLVMKDASRLTVVDHGDLYQILEDASVLAAFLNIPVWNSLEKG